MFAIPKGMRKTVVAGTFFSLVFSGKTNVQESQDPETSGSLERGRLFLDGGGSCYGTLK